MKLIGLTMSPYARKAMIVAIEKQVPLEIVSAGRPIAEDEQVRAANPLWRIPVLILDDGSSLYDSPVICEYLDCVGSGAMLVPSGHARWDVLRRTALADGVMDAAVSGRGEMVRPDGERSPGFIAAQRAAILRAARAAEEEVELLGPEPLLDQIALGVAFAYCDIRHPDLDWRAEAPTLAAWHAEIVTRPSFKETEPKG